MRGAVLLSGSVVVPGSKRVLLRFDRSVRRSRTRRVRAPGLAAVSSATSSTTSARRLHVAFRLSRQAKRRQLDRSRTCRAGRRLRRRATPRGRHECQTLERAEDRTRAGRELVRELLLQFADRVLLAVSRLRRHADPGDETRSALNGRERRSRSAVRDGAAVRVEAGMLLGGRVRLLLLLLRFLLRVTRRRSRRVCQRVIRRRG